MLWDWPVPACTACAGVPMRRLLGLWVGFGALGGLFLGMKAPVLLHGLNPFIDVLAGVLEHFRFVVTMNAASHSPWASPDLTLILFTPSHNFEIAIRFSHFLSKQPSPHQELTWWFISSDGVGLIWGESTFRSRMIH